MKVNRHLFPSALVNMVNDGKYDPDVWMSSVVRQVGSVNPKAQISEAQVKES